MTIRLSPQDIDRIEGKREEKEPGMMNDTLKSKFPRKTGRVPKNNKHKRHGSQPTLDTIDGRTERKQWI